MIEKLAVRKMLANYEKHIKEEIRKVEAEKQGIDNAIAYEAKEIWYSSNKYMELTTKYITLNIVLSEIRDMRCDEMLED
jgi:hypothetical protein